MNIFSNDAVARKYDSYYQTKSGREIDRLEKEAVVQLLNGIPRQSVLELGCGTGHWTELFSQLGFPVTATDISDAMLSIARNRKIHSVTFEKTDAMNLRFATGSFGIVATLTMLEFIQERARVFHEIYRVLRPSGWLLVGCLNKKSQLGKTKDRHEMLRHADFLTIEELSGHLSFFGEPVIRQCVHLSATFEILDGTPEQQYVEGAFIAGCVQKVK